jgi:hypothetical protein
MGMRGESKRLAMPIRHSAASYLLRLDITARHRHRSETSVIVLHQRASSNVADIMELFGHNIEKYLVYAQT